MIAITALDTLVHLRIIFFPLIDNLKSDKGENFAPFFQKCTTTAHQDGEKDYESKQDMDTN